MIPPQKLTRVYSPFKEAQMFVEKEQGDIRFWVRGETRYTTSVRQAGEFLERLAKPGRLEAVTEFLNQLDELEQ